MNKEGHLDYYLSGSLGIMQLLRAGKFEIIDSKSLPDIKAKEEKDIPPAAKEQFENFVRKIGDLDYVPLEHYQKQLDRLRKGGGGPSIAELPADAKRALKLKPETAETAKVMCDPLVTVTPHQVVRIEAGGKEVYIAEPKTMLAYKAVHLAQTFENEEKTDKFVNDFNAMLRGMETMYSRKELLKAAHETAMAYAPGSPNNTFVPFHNPKFRGELRNFFEEMIVQNPDSAFLKELQSASARERSIGILKALNRLKTPEAKHQVINFINQHPEHFDEWHINDSSSKNRGMLAELLLVRPDLLENFKSKVPHRFEGVKKVNKDVLMDMLGGEVQEVWAFDEYGKEIPNKDAIEIRPSPSKVMDILMTVDEDRLQEELTDLKSLLKPPTDIYNLERILRAQFTLKSGNNRQSLYEGIKLAQTALTSQEFNQFLFELGEATASTGEYDRKSHEWIDVKEDERPAWVSSVFRKFQIRGKF